MDDIKLLSEFKPITVEMTMVDVDPAVLGILTGGVLGTTPKPTFAVEVHAPVKRTFWQWLTRKPKMWRHILIPHARIETGDE
jgi:hypothetical protein